MALVKSRDTQPELIIKKLLHANGLRFRLQNKKLAGERKK